MSDSVKGVCAPSSDPLEMLISRIVEHEGIKSSAYQDSLGFWTIGIGTLIDERKVGKLTIDECFYLFKNRLAIKQKELQEYEWFTLLDDVRGGVVIELAFNIGTNGVCKFINMIDALKHKNYSQASKELLSSTWSSQVGKIRSDDMCYRLLNGRYK